VDVTVVDPAVASATDLTEYHQVFAASQDVDQPGELRMTYDDVIGRLHNPFPGFGPVVYWVARHEGSIVGFANVYFLEAENSHWGRRGRALG
jgi:hypothetical protein